jgi:predicted nucleotide-binding protein (sugar kinase/HSP70/actin superfamily)
MVIFTVETSVVMERDIQSIEVQMAALLGQNILCLLKSLVLLILGMAKKPKLELMRTITYMQCGWDSIICHTTHTQEITEILGARQ